MRNNRQQQNYRNRDSGASTAISRPVLIVAIVAVALFLMFGPLRPQEKSAPEGADFVPSEEQQKNESISSPQESLPNEVEWEVMPDGERKNEAVDSMAGEAYEQYLEEQHEQEQNEYEPVP